MSTFAFTCPGVEGALFLVMRATSWASFNDFSAIGKCVDDAICIDVGQAEGSNARSVDDPGIGIDRNGKCIR
jgi:hypothetical protein